MMHALFSPNVSDELRIYSGGHADAPDVRLWTDRAHVDIRVPGLTRADCDKIADILRHAFARARAGAISYKVAAE